MVRTRHQHPGWPERFISDPSPDTPMIHRFPVLALLAAATLPLATARAQGSIATYEVRFDATWSATTHPGAYPGGAHFSPLVGGTHDGSGHFWMAGGLATPGIEAMAETGATGQLSSEINAAIAVGSAG